MDAGHEDTVLVRVFGLDDVCCRCLQSDLGCRDSFDQREISLQVIDALGSMVSTSRCKLFCIVCYLLLITCSSLDFIIHSHLGKHDRLGPFAFVCNLISRQPLLDLPHVNRSMSHRMLSVSPFDVTHLLYLDSLISGYP